jgi:RNA polymerase sigma-70 factor (ECF subfamily)
MPEGEASEDGAGGFAGFFERHRRQLGLYLARLVSSPDVAEDLAQEAFARVYVVHDGTLRSPRSFLYRTAHNLAMDHMRRRKVAAAEPLTDITADTLGDGRPTPDTCLAAREELRIIEAAIQELPPKCRKVFILLRFEGRSYKEIALAMALSETMVRKYAARALEHCRQRLDDGKPLADGAKSANRIVNHLNDTGSRR